MLGWGRRLWTSKARAVPPRPIRSAPCVLPLNGARVDAMVNEDFEFDSHLPLVLGLSGFTLRWAPARLPSFLAQATAPALAGLAPTRASIPHSESDVEALILNVLRHPPYPRPFYASAPSYLYHQHGSAPTPVLWHLPGPPCAVSSLASYSTLPSPLAVTCLWGHPPRPLSQFWRTLLLSMYTSTATSCVGCTLLLSTWRRAIASAILLLCSPCSLPCPLTSRPSACH